LIWVVRGRGPNKHNEWIEPPDGSRDEEESPVFSNRMGAWAQRLWRPLAVAGVGLSLLEAVVAAQPPASRTPPLLVALPKADAGDDLIGLVGRRVTLPGRASTPAGRIGFRWIQVAGPPIRMPVQEGALLSFLPEVPGVYRFALVVAEGGVISEPDFTTVLVVAEVPQTGPAPGAASPPLTAQEAARTALASLPDGPGAAKALAEAFEEIAGRIDLYGTYADILQGTSSRLQPVLPTDPTRRAAWNERLFLPLTRRLIDDMLPAGLDLSRPEGQAVPLSAAQRTRLAEQFRALARGFRSAAPSEDPDRVPQPDRLETIPPNESK
jgi:hypothetical protein